jgi:hypothetical protein
VAAIGGGPHALIRLVELQMIPMANDMPGVAEGAKHPGFPVNPARLNRQEDPA